MRALFALFLALTVAGCGYTTGSLLPSQYKTIAIKQVVNKIDFMNQDNRTLYFPGLENQVQTALVDRFLFDGRLRIAKEDDADILMDAQLIQVNREELRLTTNEDVHEYRLRVTLSLTAIDRNDDKKVLWKEPAFAGETTYYTSGPLAKSDNAAVADAVTDLVKRVVARTVENW